MVTAICEILQMRLDRYHTRYKETPKSLPITLDEWAWLAEATDSRYVPNEFKGVSLRLVEYVFEHNGGLVVRP